MTISLSDSTLELKAETEIDRRGCRKISLIQFANAGHDILHDRLDLVSGQTEGVAFGHNADGFRGAVDDYLTRLALPKVFFDAQLHVGPGAAIQIVSEFGKKICAAKHRPPLWGDRNGERGSLSASIVHAVTGPLAPGCSGSTPQPLPRLRPG